MADHQKGSGYNPDIQEDVDVLPPTLHDTQLYLATLGVGKTGEFHHMPSDKLGPTVVIRQHNGVYCAIFDAPLTDYDGTALTDEQIRQTVFEN